MMNDDQAKEMDRIFNNIDDPSEAWESKIIKTIHSDVTTEWLLKMTRWMNFITLTFRVETPPDIAKRKLYSLIHTLNVDLLGKHYTRKVGHSYFWYAFGIEYQMRDVIHYHLITDSPIHFDLVHSFWNYHAGFAWTEIIKDQDDTVGYIAKYIQKGGEVEVYNVKKIYIVKQYPSWNCGPNSQMELPKS
jgi:hypothetical protein